MMLGLCVFYHCARLYIQCPDACVMLYSTLLNILLLSMQFDSVKGLTYRREVERAGWKVGGCILPLTTSRLIWFLLVRRCSLVLCVLVCLCLWQWICRVYAMVEKQGAYIGCGVFFGFVANLASDAYNVITCLSSKTECAEQVNTHTHRVL